jgi:hypothetical protein
MVELEDTLQERVDSLIADVEALLLEYLEENKPDSCPCLHNDLDYSGAFHEIVDSATPVYYSEIDTIHYLYGDRMEEAYNDAGIGDKSEANWKQVAIYCYLEQEAASWYQDNAEEIFEAWQSEQEQEEAN